MDRPFSSTIDSGQGYCGRWPLLQVAVRRGGKACMKIPRIIHQTWKDERIPVPLQKLAETWKQNHPGWEYRLWTDRENRDFLNTFYPAFLARYDSYPHHIQRVDAFRYFVLYTLGGLYVDLDFECFQSLDELLSEQECLFGLEPQEHCEIHNRTRIIGNALMAAAPRHAFFRAILDDLATYKPPQEHRNNLILETTGPFMLTRVYERCRPSNVTLCPSNFFYPLSLYELERAFQEGWSEIYQRKLREAFAIHYFAGTWWSRAIA
jgi:inositol phosphorylceramide mannosyltransferase catalytic subunit